MNKSILFFNLLLFLLVLTPNVHLQADLITASEDTESSLTPQAQLVDAARYREKMQLFVNILSNLDAASNIENPDVGEYALAEYNELRKLVPLPTVNSYNKIDVALLETLQYELWKDHQRELWKLSGVEGVLPQSYDLGSNIYQLITRDVPRSRFNDEFLFFPYKFLRELLGLPTSPTLQKEDRLWVETIFPELETYGLVEGIGAFKRPTNAQKKLLEKAINLLNLQGKISALQQKTGGVHGSTRISPSGITYIAMCENPDFDFMMYLLFHELAHVYHNDSKNEDLIMQGEAKPEDLSNQSAFKTDLNTVKRYLKRGIELVPSLQSTRTGKLLASHLANSIVQLTLKITGGFWIHPKDPKEYQKIHYYRGKEQRADLFAIKNLLKHNLISTILRGVELFNNPESLYLIADSSDNHPSDLERALYILGFLADQGINVRRELYKWEHQGVCTPVEEEEETATLARSELFDLERIKKEIS